VEFNDHTLAYIHFGILVLVSDTLAITCKGEPHLIQDATASCTTQSAVANIADNQSCMGKVRATYPSTPCASGSCTVGVRLLTALRFVF